MTSRSQHPREAISACLDGELEPSERTALERHLADCGECRLLLADLRRLGEAVAQEEPPPIPADLADRISRRLGSSRSGEPARPSRRAWIWRVPAAAAAGLAALAILSLFWIGDRSPDKERAKVQVAQSGIEAGQEALKESRADDLTAPSPGKPRGTLDDIQAEPGGQARERDESATVGRHEDPGGLRDRAGERDQEPGAQKRTSLLAPRTEAGGAEAARPEATEQEAAGSRLSGKDKQDTDALARRNASTGFAGEPTASADLAPPATPGAEALPVAARADAPQGRTLLLEGPEYRISVAETGWLTLTSGSYECTVSTLKGINEEGEDLPLGRMEEEPIKEESEDGREIKRLFASIQDVPDGEQRPESQMKTGAEAAQSAPPSPWTLSLIEPGRPTAAPEGLAEDRTRRGTGAGDLGRRMHSLVTEKYRRLMESACGPLPEPLPEPE